ncbi:unnamed protein product, partial [Rotaria sp. Silwood2]
MIESEYRNPIQLLIESILKPSLHSQQHIDFKNGVIRPFNHDDSDKNEEKDEKENKKKDLSIYIDYEIKQQQQQQPKQQHIRQKQSYLGFPCKLFNIIEENNQSIELIIHSIDYEFNESDWIFTEDDEKYQQQFTNIDIWYLSLYEFPKKDWPIVLLDYSNIHSLRHQLKMRHRLLLEVDHNKRFYICHENEMKQKVIEYMNHTGAYMLLQDLNRTDHNYIGRILNTIMQRLTTKLNDLLDRKCISEDQSQQIRMDPSRIRLDFLSFDADTRQ